MFLACFLHKGNLSWGSHRVINNVIAQPIHERREQAFTGIKLMTCLASTLDVAIICQARTMIICRSLGQNDGALAVINYDNFESLRNERLTSYFKPILISIIPGKIYIITKTVRIKNICHSYLIQQNVHICSHLNVYNKHLNSMNANVVFSIFTVLKLYSSLTFLVSQITGAFFDLLEIFFGIINGRIILNQEISLQGQFF